MSSRQDAARREKKMDGQDERPNEQKTGPFPLRESDGSALDYDTVEQSQSLALALALASAANDVKAVDIAVLDVSKVVSWTRYMVLATAFSKPQVDAAVGKMIAAAEAPPLGRSLAHTPDISSWVCLDFGDVMAHCFTPGDCAFYDLAGLYAKADKVPLPFESQKGA